MQVLAGGPIWEIPIDQLKWTLDVNLMGVIYGIKVFVPIMKKQNTPCHIVNVSSHAGLTSNAHFTPYQISKHAVVTITESLQQDLIAYGYNNIAASIFFPFFVQSNIANTGRHLEQKGTSLHISEQAQPF
ncbi:MAG: short-chain dehydrogenase/reductase [Burkholderiales bacterium]|jgi:NADP-dependent 3-hydroxy acid dehydrogenase YdfG|nr:short-chain dehydrogenase/reductase [Burkholderiales bacterium]